MWESYSRKTTAWQRRKHGVRSYSPFSGNGMVMAVTLMVTIDGVGPGEYGSKRLPCNELEQARVYISTLNREQDELCIRLHS